MALSVGNATPETVTSTSAQRKIGKNWRFGTDGKRTKRNQHPREDLTERLRQSVQHSEITEWKAMFHKHLELVYSTMKKLEEEIIVMHNTKKRLNPSLQILTNGLIK